MEQVITNRIRKTKRLEAGFTLIELMIVLAIISILMALSAASFSRYSKSALLTRTGDQLIGMMTQAQQRAIADNSDVEIRFYEPLDNDGFSPQWAILTTRENSDGTNSAVDSPYYFPEGIIMNRSAEVSSLIGALPKQKDSDSLISDSSGESRNYTSFRFYSNGSTDLPVTANGDTWHVTLMDLQDGDGSDTNPPSNFFTIRIDPFTGTIRNFRP